MRQPGSFSAAPCLKPGCILGWGFSMIPLEWFRVSFHFSGFLSSQGFVLLPFGGMSARCSRSIIREERWEPFPKRLVPATCSFFVWSWCEVHKLLFVNIS